MKKSIFLLLALLPLAGCDEQRKEYQNGADSVYIVTVKGHDYVIYDGYHQGGIVTLFANSYFELYANDLHKVARIEKQIEEMGSGGDMSDVISSAIDAAKGEVIDELTLCLDKTKVTRIYKVLNDVGTQRSTTYRWIDTNMRHE